MPRVGARAPGISEGDGGRALRQRLLERRGEIEQAFLARTFAISDPADVPDPAYVAGLRAAISAALDFALEGLESGGRRLPSPPVVLLTQARFAARSGIGLDVVLRRYFAGYTLLTDFLVEEAERDGSSQGAVLKAQLRLGSAIFDRLVSTVTEEYVRESPVLPASSEQVRVEQIQRLLDGELVDLTLLDYDFEAWHVALVVSGERFGEALSGVASELDCRLLAVSRPAGVIWAWLGRRRPPDPAAVQARLTAAFPTGGAVSMGEPAGGLVGWRLSHRQAAAALPIAARHRAAVVRYADFALLAATFGDGLLADSLQQLYIAPLERDRDRGKVLIETLRAYFAASHNVSATAAALRISRQAVTSRLRNVEARIGRAIGECVGELETALVRDELMNGALDGGGLHVSSREPSPHAN